MSDLQRRSELLLQKRGYLTASIERRKTFPAKGRQKCRACGQVPLVSIAVDLFNVFDLIALRPIPDLEPAGDSDATSDVVFVQVTSSANHAARRNKIIASAEAKLCLLSGARILIQSWRKKENRWQSFDEWLSLDQFAVGLPDTVEMFYADQARLNLLDRKKRLPPLPPGTTLPLSEGLKDSELPF
jgi:hypothetical protein